MCDRLNLAAIGLDHQVGDLAIQRITDCHQLFEDFAAIADMVVETDGRKVKAVVIASRLPQRNCGRGI